MDKRKYNASGCLDLTAFEAIRHIEQENKPVNKDKERVKRLIHIIRRECDKAGFQVEERIILKDKKTGKIWR